MQGIEDTRGIEATRRIGAIAAASTAAAGVVALGMGVTTPPRSGPNCAAGCLSYPYDAAGAYVPGDFLWMIPALVMMAGLLVVTLALREAAAPGRRLSASIAASAAILATGLIAADYAMQLAVVAPSLLRGEGSDVVLLSMYNPHGVFIALEDAGYLLLAVSLGAVAWAVPACGRLAAAIRASGAVVVVATVGAFAYFVATLGGNLDYQFEVAAIGITWLGCIVMGGLISVWFRRSAQAARSSVPSSAA